MADISVEQKSGGMTWLWALLAVASVAGFMIWLFVQSERADTVAAVEGDTTAASAAAGGGAAGGETTELSAIAATPDAFAGRTLQVNGISVAATVGPRAFWGDVPGQNPFLVIVSQADQSVSAGQAFNVVGTVRAVDEAALNEWVQSGAISEAQRDEASFATHALVAEQATAAAAAGQ